ncbi:SDR family NAD(P)-dependent oxidoreductase [Sphingopyxis sp. MG]|uniref:SDR family NAD(P)-dependent oxidoreductase n=1 Tax=Sphingopyxis sp. MG TaxID=1866325 RepID=UPI000CDF46C4|nr:SDR family NAD(P)-dependent oxidoreductase [Sphingopyxis sp. MG]AVA15998.1 NAD-dependent oxidoreductase [Sphingopyxis sp. MG]
MQQRSIIITGAFGFLGSAVSAAFARDGCAVAQVDFAAAPASADSSAVLFGGIDLSRHGSAEHVVGEIMRVHGGIDVVINIAGGFLWETIADGTIDSWKRMFEMNALSAFAMCSAVLPALRSRPGARIINVGSASAVHAASGMAPYAASKAAVHRLTESLAAELADDDITVNAILPGIIDTPGNRAAMPDADHGKWVTAGSIVEVIQFLASPAARAITGALIPVTRGTS